MDKVIFLLEKARFTPQVVDKFTRRDLEKWAMEGSYIGDDGFMKIDANRYESVDDALRGEMLVDKNEIEEEFYVKPFGF